VSQTSDDVGVDAGEDAADGGAILDPKFEEEGGGTVVGSFSGCACEVGGPRPSRYGLVSLLAGLAVLALRRR
jgi:MYXO-CTERM domain-containing protein